MIIFANIKSLTVSSFNIILSTKSIFVFFQFFMHLIFVLQLVFLIILANNYGEGMNSSITHIGIWGTFGLNSNIKYVFTYYASAARCWRHYVLPISVCTSHISSPLNKLSFHNKANHLIFKHKVRGHKRIISVFTNIPVLRLCPLCYFS